MATALLAELLVTQGLLAADSEAALGVNGVDSGIGIVNGDAGLGEHLRRRALAHANGTGEAENDHP